MSIWFYVIWYSGAALVVALAWLMSARIGSRRARRAVRLAAVAAGFTTVPLFTPDGSAWIPIGLYYLTGGPARFEAWRKATIVIGAVWLILMIVSLGFDLVASAVQRSHASGSH